MALAGLEVKPGKGEMMKVKEKIFEVPLPGIERSAEIVIRRQGQEHPADGDRVVIRWEIHLPADDMGNLLPDLQFGRRVEINGYQLHAYWGGSYNESGPSKVTAGVVKAATWAAGFREAEQFCYRELDKLAAALARRQQALLDAEVEEDDGLNIDLKDEVDYEAELQALG